VAAVRGQVVDGNTLPDESGFGCDRDHAAEASGYQ
jgi:hypothetical protein